MVLGLVLLSTLIAAISGGLSVLMGAGWLVALSVYISTGVASSFLIMLRLIYLELRGSGPGGPPAPAPALSV